MKLKGNMKKSNLSSKLRYNWFIDAVLFLGALLAVLTGIYFLVYPVGGYMGGRNPDYGIIFIFGRETWEVLHDWTGIAMIAAALIHIVFHWKWIVGTLKRIFRMISRKAERFGNRLFWTIVIDAIIAIGFFLSAFSGLYFFFAAKDANWLLLDTTWDMIHTWSSDIMIIAALIHIILHWDWIKNITAKIFGKKKVKAVTSPATTITTSQTEL
jgi:hypothetical protein